MQDTLRTIAGALRRRPVRHGDADRSTRCSGGRGGGCCAANGRSRATSSGPATTRAIPGLTYLAEVYWGLEGTLLDQGFDFAYDKRLLDCLHSADSGACVRHLLSADPRHGPRLARFLENHDEPRSVVALGRAPARGGSAGRDAARDALLFRRAVRGAPRQGAGAAGEVARRAGRTRPSGRSHDRVLRFASDRLLHDGDWALLPVTSAGDHTFWDIVAYRWRSGTELVVVVANPGECQAQANLAIAGDLFPGAAFDFEDALTDARYRWTRESLEATGLYVRLEPGGAHLFNVRDV